MLAELEDVHNESKAPAADWPILGGISYQGNPLVIEESPDPNNSGAEYRTDPWHNDGFGFAEKYKVEYGTSDLSSGGSQPDRPPIAALFHEFAHVYDYGNNTSAEGDHEGDPGTGTDRGVENDEREAVGLPIDEDNDPNTVGQQHPDHPYDLTENAFREEMGWPKRDSYR
jgi:hypothetical protein